jgi:phosphate starvation-inducible protein PhoH
MCYGRSINGTEGPLSKNRVHSSELPGSGSRDSSHNGMKKKRVTTPPSSPSSPSTTTAVPREPKTKVKITDLKSVVPLTKNQETFFRLYRHESAFLLSGVAGTGKTYIALYNALREVLDRSTPRNKIVIVRSAVASRDIGHLPGDEKEKTEVYVRPYVDICADLLPRFGTQAFARLKEQKVVDFMITSFVRGLTIDNAIIVVDECQNMTDHELNSVMTRLGRDSKIVLCGDFRQTDLHKKTDVSGFQQFLNIIKHMPSFHTIDFEIEDILRSDLVREFIIARLTAGII